MRPSFLLGTFLCFMGTFLLLFEVFNCLLGNILFMMNFYSAIVSFYLFVRKSPMFTAKCMLGTFTKINLLLVTVKY